MTPTAGKKGSLLSYVRELKAKHRDCVILTPILVIEYCGIHPMGGKARARCPLQNIQRTLGGLTSTGYKVAVFEEASNIDYAVNGMNGSSRQGGRALKLECLHRLLALAIQLSL